MSEAMNMQQKLERLAHGGEDLTPACQECNGTGRYTYCVSGLDEDETGTERCPKCGGSGKASA